MNQSKPRRNPLRPTYVCVACTSLPGFIAGGFVETGHRFPRECPFEDVHDNRIYFDKGRVLRNSNLKKKVARFWNIFSRFWDVFLEGGGWSN